MTFFKKKNSPSSFFLSPFVSPSLDNTSTPFYPFLTLSLFFSPFSVHLLELESPKKIPQQNPDEPKAK
jgi:hypothetical protein